MIITVYLSLLYHTKNYQGTITDYENKACPGQLYHTKNYQGTITNSICSVNSGTIIPYQELSGNYNSITSGISNETNYTIPRTIREL